MQRFFDIFSSIDLFTLSLDHHQDKIQCDHCLKNNQFISHGIIYKQSSMTERKPSGKRIICSNRYGRSGCGRTTQLYVSNRIPRLHYEASVVFVFISHLLAKVCVTQVYQQATGQFEARNAWRWLTKLMLQLSAYRGTLITRAHSLIDWHINMTTLRVWHPNKIKPKFHTHFTQPSDDLSRHMKHKSSD
jgi:hypothetical protein